MTAPLVRPGHCCPSCGQLVPVRSGFVPADAWRVRTLEAISEDLGHSRGDGWRFVEVLVARADECVHVDDLADVLAVHPQTLTGRFDRCGLPKPKRYLVGVRLVRAAFFLESPDETLSHAAPLLGFGTSQCFARHCRTYLGMTGDAFRKQYDGERMLARFRAEMIQPYTRQLRTLPLLAADIIAAKRRLRRAA